MVDRSPEAVAWKPAVFEAMLLLTLARLLVSGPPMRRWRRLLGQPSDTALAGAAPNGRISTFSRAVLRAAQRLPFETKCLPRAMALHWMLRRRGEPSELVIAVLHPSKRGSIESLHAWVEYHGSVIIGELDQPFVPVARFN